jgi:hypothetical protein
MIVRNRATEFKCTHNFIAALFAEEMHAKRVRPRRPRKHHFRDSVGKLSWAAGTACNLQRVLE